MVVVVAVVVVVVVVAAWREEQNEKCVGVCGREGGGDHVWCITHAQRAAEVDGGVFLSDNCRAAADGKRQ